MAASAVFDQLVTRHEHEVLAVCRSVLRDESRSRDAAQETFLRLWKRLTDRRREDHPGNVQGWLRKVALSTSLDALRAGRAQRSEPLDAHVDEVAERALARSEAPDRGLLDRELRDAYERALDELPEGQRVVFLLRHEGGLRLTDVADTLGVARATVKTQFARACVRLQAHLNPFAPPTDRTSRDTER